VKTLSIVSEMV